MGRVGGRGKLIAAFAAVYVIWGSTYLAIRFAIETMPPFLMASTRFLVAGAILYAWTMARGAPRPTRVNWKAAIIIGAMLLAAGNGAVVWSELRVPSGVVALVVAVVPLWMVLIDWRFGSRRRPTGLVIGGVLLGLLGLFMLIGPGALLGDGQIDTLGMVVVMMGSLSWAAGSIYARSAPLPKLQLQGAAMEMLAGGALLGLFGIALGEPGQVVWSQIDLKSLLSVLYLIFFGSLVAYSAYIYLLGATTAARVATYAYVNPVVAVLLGWAFADEALTPRMLVAAAVIIAAVAVITMTGGAGRGRGLGRGNNNRNNRNNGGNGNNDGNINGNNDGRASPSPSPRAS